MEVVRVAWLLPSAFYYWHPPISHFARTFPLTKVFTGRWQGYAKGSEGTFQLELVGDRKVFSLIPAKTGYGISFTYVSPSIVSKLIRFRPDVIFTNSFGLWSLLALALKSLMGWRVVLAYEGSSPSVDFRNSPTRLALRKVMAGMVDAFISNSHAGKAYLTECLEVDEERIFVQPYEVPAIEALSASPNCLDENAAEWQTPIFLYVGHIIPRKGINLLLDACQKLKESNSDRFTLLIVGDGPQKLELEAYAQAIGIQGVVRWIGRVPYDCLGSYFTKADAFVLPTLEDTWGMVVLEAMASGTAVICSSFAGAAELIQEGKNGFVVNPKNPEALATAMQQFITEPMLGDHLGKGALSCIAQNSPAAAGEFLVRVTNFVLQH
jgi:glycosyltransferase involved in cell wall biosynthesis